MESNKLNRNYKHKRQSGSAMLELALGFPVLLLVLCGTADFGRMFYTSIVVNNAARAGAQYAALWPTHANDITNIVLAAKNDANNMAGLTVSAVQACTCNGAAVSCTSVCNGTVPVAYVTVNTRATFKTFLAYAGIPASTVINGSATMRTR